MIDNFQEFMTFLTQYITKEIMANLVATGIVISGLWTAFDILWDLFRKPEGGFTHMSSHTRALYRESTNLEMSASRDEGLCAALKIQRDRLLADRGFGTAVPSSVSPGSAPASPAPSLGGLPPLPQGSGSTTSLPSLPPLPPRSSLPPLPALPVQ